MFNRLRFLAPAYLSLLLLLLAFAAADTSTAYAYGDQGWKPIDPAHLALKTPAVERDADAEALFWEVRVADEADGREPRTVLSHYIRIKIFTERGRESQSKVELPFGTVFGREFKIKDIAGRTIKADGTIVELKKEDIFERTAQKMSGVKIKVKSFAMPSVEPGAIIEYRWREVRGDSISLYDRLELSRDIPVQLVTYYVKPLSLPNFPYGMRVQNFHARNSPFQKEKDGFYSTTMTNVPAFREEPRMPPEYAVRPWLLVYYTEDTKLDPGKFWTQYGKLVYESSKSAMKVSNEVKQATATAIGDATTDEEKLRRIFEFCRSKIKNINDDASGMTSEERAKWKENKSPADTLKRGMGTDGNIDFLFAAMATAAGFDARLARLADRSDTFFDMNFPDDYFINTYDIAVRVGNEWRFYDPATTFVPYGMLRWQEEGADALISDPKEPMFVKTPLSPPDKSVERRTAKLALAEDGTLEGEVRIEYTGHLGSDKKEYNDDDSPAEREETLRSQIKAHMSTAELSNIRIENVTDPVKPFVYAYHVRVPGYAQRTGKRLFLQPAFFQRGANPVFPTSQRQHEIYFHYPWSEEDDVTFNLPAGFALDNGDAPTSINGGEISRYDIKIGVTKDGRTLVYQRKFFFGGGQRGLLYPVASYAQLKQLFDEVHKRDNHMLSLKQAATTAAAGAPSN
ncbi:MAG TPA: DUF3857 domain-containing protein [Pyrinomonadaceae bacterium]|jgi:hypothetical protein|nr:DUF3857 domain-containing protein [Pyrinomonadaceae bacterium]